MNIRKGITEPQGDFVEFATTWNILGPFQIGTREAAWGTDPLEYHGGFGSLDPDNKTYASSLGISGQVEWSTVQAVTQPVQACETNLDKADICFSTALSVGFPHLDWQALQAIYGWAAFQWQAWLRGTFTIYSTEHRVVKLFLPGILEYEVDGEKHFGSDFFSFSKAPLISTFSPGQHTINIRVVRDVRAMGGVGQPLVDFNILAQFTEPGLEVLEKDIVFPDFVPGYGYTGSIFSVPVQNTSDEYVEILSINFDKQNEGEGTVSLLDESKISVAPGQTKSVNVRFDIFDVAKAASFRFQLTYKVPSSDDINCSKTCTAKPEVRSAQEPQKIVFNLPNGTVSYALLRPPSPRISTSKHNAPVLLVLHGAGFEIESPESRQMLQDMKDIHAWVLLPTGGTSWSADDWHVWGSSDVDAALNAIPKYVNKTTWNGPGVDPQNLHIVGHSNGGQGTWHLLTRWPDRFRSAAAISGYTSIQKYVPYNFVHEADPKISSLIEISLSSYRHELLVANAQGIPIQQQHGSADDNVPPFHSRRIFQLLQESGSSPAYNEIPSKGHWYLGIMTTPFMRKFYDRIADHNKESGYLPQRFSVVAPASGDVIRSRGGILIEQLRSVGQLGRIDVEQVRKDLWNIKTSNIFRLRIGSHDYADHYPKSVTIDRTSLDLGNVSATDPVWVALDREGNWKMSTNSSWKCIEERSGPQGGTINAILRTKHELHIQSRSESTFKIALQISRNLFQYYSANSTIINGTSSENVKGNIITLVQATSPADLQIMNTKAPLLSGLHYSNEGIEVRGSASINRVYPYQPGLGTIYLKPKEEECLELVIWGYDKEGLERAARLAPGLAGVGQPDFVILGTESAWKGAAGVLAMGYFDHDWTISVSSYIS